MGHRGRLPRRGEVVGAEAPKDLLIAWGQVPFSLAVRPIRSTLQGRTGASVSADRAHSEKQVDVPVLARGLWKLDRGKGTPLRIGDPEHRHEGVVGGEVAQAGRRLGIGHDPHELRGMNVIASRCRDALAKQPGHSGSERLGKAAEGVASWFPFAALDLGDETLADARPVSKLTLGEAGGEAG